jgi:hypothetical protein
MIQQVAATYDSALMARVMRVTPLRYTEAADTVLDRPLHVRAGSSLAQVGDRMAVVQDDANFIALIDPQGHDVRAVPLPVGAGGLRQFDDLRGNKRFKLDLEACVVLPDPPGDVLLAFGSGSSPLREQIAIIRGIGDAMPNVALVEAPELYAALRGAVGFAGSQMNIEGAVFVDGYIRLFGRGNGLTVHGVLPLDATCDLVWPALATYLEAPRTAPWPLPKGIVQYQLGSLGGVRLGFTDATVAGGRVYFSAAAEASPDATRDGPVAGSALGVFDTREQVRWTELRDRDGALFVGKVEGLLLDSANAKRAYIVVDRDDPAQPSELCEVEFGGPW